MLLMGIDTSALKDSDVHLLRACLCYALPAILCGSLLYLMGWAALDFQWSDTEKSAWGFLGFVSTSLAWLVGVVGGVFATVVPVLFLLGKGSEHYESFKSNTPIEGRDSK